MESKKVKVKLVVGYKQYRVIEVEESEVEKIREVNRMTWRELKQEMRKKESMVMIVVYILTFLSFFAIIIKKFPKREQHNGNEKRRYGTQTVP